MPRAAALAAFLLEHACSRQGRRGRYAAHARSATLESRRAALYERFGFRVAGVRRDYYTDPVEDALVLWRED